MICRNCGGNIYVEVITEQKYGEIIIRKCESCHQSVNCVHLRSVKSKEEMEELHGWVTGILGE